MLSLRDGKVKADRASYRHCNRLSRPGQKCWRTDRVPILPGPVRSWSLPWCVLTVHGNESCIHLTLSKGCVYLISMYYTRFELQWRLSLFFSASILAGAISGLLAYAIANMGGVGGYEAWRW